MENTCGRREALGKERGFYGNPWLHIIIILILGALVYSNTLDVPLLFDDYVYLQENPLIKRPLLLFDAEAARALDLPFNVDHHLKTRTVAFLTFAANYALHGYDVTGYHLVNLLLHLANAVMLYFLALAVFSTPALRGAVKCENHAALLAAALFVSHPVQTQAVTYITQRFTTLAVFFYLASLLCYLRFRLRGGEGKAFYISPAFIFSILFALLSMKTKEISFTLPFAVLLIEWVLFGLRGRGVLKHSWPFLLMLPVVPLLLMDFGREGAGVVEEALHLDSGLPGWKYLIIQGKVIFTYLRLLVLPVGQTLDYDYFQPSVFSVTIAFVVFALLLGLLAFSIYLYTKKREGRPMLVLALFGWFWFLLTLAVESTVIPLGDLIFEHRIYLPSVMIFIAVGGGLLTLRERLGGRELWGGLTAILVILPLIYGVAAYERNKVWQSGITLWQDTARKSPEKERVRYNLARHYLKAGQYEKAIEEIRELLKQNPVHLKSLHSIGWALLELGRYREAAETFERILEISPEDPIALSNLGGIYLTLGQDRQAIEIFERTVPLMPENPTVRYNLALAYLEVGEEGEAREQLRKVLELDPGDAAAGELLDSLPQGSETN